MAFIGGYNPENPLQKQSVEKIRVIATQELQGDIMFDQIEVTDTLTLEGLNKDANLQFQQVSVHKVNINMFSNFGSVVFQGLQSDGRKDSKFYVRLSNLGNTTFFSSDLSTFDKIEFENSVVNDIVVSNVIWFDPNRVNLHLSTKDKKYWIQRKETFRQLKYSMEENKDRSQALVFKTYEMDAFRRSLKLSRRTWSDILLLNLNNISNKHGLKWIRAVLFTLGASFLGYSMFIMAADDFSFFKSTDWIFLPTTGKFWAGLVSFLWLPEGIDDLTIFLAEGHSVFILILGTAFYIIGKILVAYGIFQIISAFRKYVKN